MSALMVKQDVEQMQNATIQLEISLVCVMLDFLAMDTLAKAFSFPNL